MPSLDAWKLSFFLFARRLELSERETDLARADLWAGTDLIAATKARESGIAPRPIWRRRELEEGDVAAF